MSAFPPQKKAAFTLAEVLITLGIIGVVAAMTLPVLIQKQNEREIVSRLKKTYSILSQAIIKSQLEYGGFETWDPFDTSGANPEDGGSPTSMKSFFNTFKDDLKILKVCEDTAGCWHQGRTKNLGGAVIGRDSIGIGLGVLSFTLVDGTNISIDDHNVSQINNWFGCNYNKSSYVIYIDANGNKKPNTMGRDIFPFCMTNKGLIPAGSHSNLYCNPNSTTAYNGSTCTAKVLSEDKISY